MTDVAFVCVAYETPEHLSAFVEQFMNAPGALHARMLVVDNSAEAHAGLVRKALTVSRVDYFHTPQNLGYFGGARFALDRLAESGGVPRWVVVSNVDLRFDIDQLIARLRLLQAREDVGVVAPRLVSHATGQDLNPFMRSRPGRLRMGFYCIAFRFHWVIQAYSWAGHWFHTVRAWLRRDRAGTAVVDDDVALEEIYAPHGALLALSREYFQRGGTLRHDVFLFGEEVTIAERARRLGVKIIYDPGCRIDHLDSASTGHVRSRKVGKHMHEAAVYCFRKYFSKSS